MTLREKMVKAFGSVHVERPNQNGGSMVELFFNDATGVGRWADGSQRGTFDDLRDQGNGLVSLSLSDAVQVYVRAGSGLPPAGPAAVVVDDKAQAGAAPSPAGLMPQGMSYDHTTEILVVDGVKLHRNFFQALGDEIPIGGYFRIDGRDPFDAVQVPAPEPAPDAAVAMANASRLVELEAELAKIEAVEHELDQVRAAVHAHMGVNAEESLLEAIARNANELSELRLAEARRRAAADAETPAVDKGEAA